MKELFIIILIGCFLKMHIDHKRFMKTEVKTLSYNQDILPIIQNRCAGCHNYSTPERNLLIYRIAFNKRLSIRMRLQDGSMPISGFTMLDSERRLMIDWVNQGAKK